MKHTQETKQRISNSIRRRYANGLTDEHKKNISNGQLKRFADIRTQLATLESLMANSN